MGKAEKAGTAQPLRTVTEAHGSPAALPPLPGAGRPARGPGSLGDPGSPPGLRQTVGGRGSDCLTFAVCGAGRKGPQARGPHPRGFLDSGAGMVCGGGGVASGGVEEPGAALWAEKGGRVGRSRPGQVWCVPKRRGGPWRSGSCRATFPGSRPGAGEKPSGRLLERLSVLGSPRKPTAAPAPGRRAQDAARTERRHAAAAGVSA